MAAELFNLTGKRVYVAGHRGMVGSAIVRCLAVTSSEIIVAEREQVDLVFDPSRPDGVPRKLLDGSKLAKMGWRARTSLRTGLERTYSAFRSGIYRIEGKDQCARTRVAQR